MPTVSDKKLFVGIFIGKYFGCMMQLPLMGARSETPFIQFVRKNVFDHDPDRQHGIGNVVVLIKSPAPDVTLPIDHHPLGRVLGEFIDYIHEVL